MHLSSATHPSHKLSINIPRYKTFFSKYVLWLTLQVKSVRVYLLDISVVSSCFFLSFVFVIFVEAITHLYL